MSSQLQVGRTSSTKGIWLEMMGLQAGLTKSMGKLGAKGMSGARDERDSRLPELQEVD